jgi:hypothetical protein
MRQLMTWCATRALDDKPSGSRSDDDSARLAGMFLVYRTKVWQAGSNPFQLELSKKSFFRIFQTSPS